MTSGQWSALHSTCWRISMLCDAPTKLSERMSGARCSMMGTLASGSSAFSRFSPDATAAQML